MYKKEGRKQYLNAERTERKKKVRKEETNKQGKEETNRKKAAW